MAIYEIPTLEKAVEIMEQACLTPCAFVPIVFDLNEAIDPNDVRTRISQCQSCDLTIHQNFGEYATECPRCGEDHLQVLVEAMLVIQGSVVFYAAWRDS